MSAVTIKYTNLLEEARYAFLAGDFYKAELLLAEACVMASHERNLLEAGIAS